MFGQTQPKDPLALLKQRICKEIVVTGACRGFAEFFALTHNPQPSSCEITTPDIPPIDDILEIYARENPQPEPGKVLILSEKVLEILQNNLTIGDLSIIDENYEEASNAYANLTRLFRSLDSATPNHFRHTNWSPYDTKVIGLTCDFDEKLSDKLFKRQKPRGVKMNRSSKISEVANDYTLTPSPMYDDEKTSKLIIQTRTSDFDRYLDGESKFPFNIEPLINNVSNEDPIPLSIYYAEKALKTYKLGGNSKKIPELEFNLGLSLLDCGFPVQALIPFSNFILGNKDNVLSSLNKKHTGSVEGINGESSINIDDINETKIANIPPSERAIFSMETEEKCAICEYIALETFVRVALVIIQEVISTTNNGSKKQADVNTTAAICSSPQIQVSKLVAHIGDNETPYGTKIPTNFDTLDATFTPKSTIQKNNTFKQLGSGTSGLSFSSTHPASSPTFSPISPSTNNVLSRETNKEENTINKLGNFTQCSSSHPQIASQSIISSSSMERLESVLSLLSFCIKMSPFWQLSVTALELTAKTYHLMGRYEDAEASFVLMREEAKKKDNEVGRSCATRALTGAAMFAAARGDLIHAKTLLEERVSLAEENYASDAKIDSAMDALGAALSLGFLKSKMNMIKEAAEQFASAWDVALFVGHGAKKPETPTKIETFGEKFDASSGTNQTNQKSLVEGTNRKDDILAKISNFKNKNNSDTEGNIMEESGQTRLARVGLGIATGIMKEDEVFKQIADGNYEF